MKKIIAFAALTLLISCMNKENRKQLAREDDAACFSYGYKANTTGFLYCKEQLKLERREKKYPEAANNTNYHNYIHQYGNNDAAAYDLELRRERLRKAQEIDQKAIVSKQEAIEYLNRPVGTSLHEDSTNANRQYIKKSDLSGKVEIEEKHNKHSKIVTTDYTDNNDMDEKTEVNVEKRNKLSEIDGNIPQVDQKDLKAREVREKNFFSKTAE